MERKFGVAALGPKGYAVFKLRSEATREPAGYSGRTTKNRRGPGKPFVPGRSGNPSDRRKRTPEELDLLAVRKSKTPEALAVIANLMSTSRDDRVGMDAALAIIERAHGRPTPSTTLSGGAGGPVQVEAVRTTDWVALGAALQNRSTPGT